MLTLEVSLDGKKIPADTPDKWEALDRTASSCRKRLGILPLYFHADSARNCTKDRDALNGLTVPVQGQ